MKVAVVRNRKNRGVLSRLGLPSPEKYGRRSVQSVMDALRAGGHTVKVMEGDMMMFSHLQDFIPLDPATRRLSGMVFNMSYGIQGEARYSHVPIMLEMAGVPYTGAGPYGHAICLDKVLAKTVMERARIATPRFCALSQPGQRTNGLGFPLIVKPRHESTSNGLELVHDPAGLERAVQAIVTEYCQDALVEEYIEGREIVACLLGNDDVEVLPLVELDFRGRSQKIVTRSDKFHKTPNEPQKLCPAPLSAAQSAQMRDIAIAAYRLCRCRDYARVDFRLDAAGRPFVLEINSTPTLGRGGGFVLAARKAGYSFQQLVCRILDIAHESYFGCPAPRGGIEHDASGPSADPAITPLQPHASPGGGDTSSGR